MPEDEAQGPGDAKVWVSSHLPAKVIEFERRLEQEPDKVDLAEIRMVVSQNFVGQAEASAWLRYIQNLEARPYYDFGRRASDGKVHRYRIDWGFGNPKVRGLFLTVLHDELRKKALKMDPISALGFMMGTCRPGGEGEKRQLRPKGGGPQL